jgi:hypothetical protein
MFVSAVSRLSTGSSIDLCTVAGGIRRTICDFANPNFVTINTSVIFCALSGNRKRQLADRVALSLVQKNILDGELPANLVRVLSQPATATHGFVKAE